MRRLGKLWLAAVAILFCSAATGWSVARAAPPPPWKTDAAYHRALASSFEFVDWPKGSRLRDRLMWLSEWQRVAIFLDRRIDPGRAIALQAQEITLAQVLDETAAQCDAAVVQVGFVVYLGPREGVAGLSRIAQQRLQDARALPAKQAQRLLNTRPWGWPELSEPRQLVAELAEESEVVVEGMERIPHDLWPAVDLPPLRWTDRLTILLAGFGLTFEFSGGGDRIRLVPMPVSTSLTRSYRTALPQMNLEALASQFPRAEIERSAGGFSLTGTEEDHERLQRLLARQATPAPRRSGRGTRVHSLRVTQQPVDAILKTLQRQLPVRLEYGPGTEEALQTRVSFDLQNASVEELLHATLTPAGLTHRREGDAVRIELLRRP